jgi:hypothetical protein
MTEGGNRPASKQVWRAYFLIGVAIHQSLCMGFDDTVGKKHETGTRRGAAYSIEPLASSEESGKSKRAGRGACRSPTMRGDSL